MKFLSSINVNHKYTLPIVDGSAGQALVTDGGGEVYWETISTSVALNDLTDVIITTPAKDQLLRYNGTNWVNWSPNFLTAESDTLNTVVQRGASTLSSITVGGLNVNGTATITGTLTVPKLEKNGSQIISSIEQTEFEGQVVKIASFQWFITEIAKIESNGKLTAGSFVKYGGTSSQFLKADGSVDTNTYLTSLPAHTHTNATTSVAGFMSTTDKSKLDGIATNANNFSLPTATASVLGGVKVGGTLTISSEILNARIYVGASSSNEFGLIEQGIESIEEITEGGAGGDGVAGYVPAASSAQYLSFLRGDGTWQTLTDTVTRLRQSGGTLAAGDFTFAGSGATTISLNSGVFTISSTDTDTNTTYTAGTGLTLTGTTFSVTANTFAAASHVHTIANVTGLQTALDGKASTLHTHAASDITSGILSTDRLPKQELGISIVGNFGQWQAHGAYTNFNTDVAYWGWNFVQGGTNAPHQISAQWYRGRFSLGDEYGFGTSPGDYWMEIAIPRYNQSSTSGNLFVRTAENGVINGWQGVRAAYATEAASAAYAEESGYSASSGSVEWTNVQKKPATFPPSAHTHTISDVTNLQTALDGKLSAEADTLASVTGRGASTTTALYLAGGSGEVPALHIRSGGNSWSEGLAIHPSTNSGYALSFYRTRAAYNDQTNTWAIGNLGESNALNHFALLRKGLTGGVADRAGDAIFTINPTGAFKFGFNPSVGGNVIWHAGNDGGGSGLDADSVDGVHASNIVWGNANGTNDSVTTDADGLDKTGFYTSSGFVTRPEAVGDWMYIQHIKLYNNNSHYQKQIGYDTYDDSMWVRTKSGNIWSSWKPILTSENIGFYALTSLPAHTHAISDVTNLQTALDGKQASLGFTPYNATNPSGYISSYVDTVTSVGIVDDLSTGDIVLKGGGATTITKVGGTITITSTDTDTNTTYSAGTGLTLSGTTFSVTANTFAAASHNHDDRYYTETEADARFILNDFGAQTAATAEDEKSGTWAESAGNLSWGSYKPGDDFIAGYSYNDAPGYVQYNIPTGYATAYIGQLRWSSGGYFDVHAVMSDGSLVFRGRYLSKNSIENENHSGNHDGQQIIKISGLDGMRSLRITNLSGRLHLQGIGWSKEADTANTQVSETHWDLIYDKPGSFTPSAHTHTISDVTGLQTALDGKVPITRTITINGTTLDLSANRSFTVSSADGYISNVQLGEEGLLKFAGEGSAFTGNIDLSTLPFQPVGTYLTSLPAHTHTIANVTGLQSALDGKAASSHTHSIANITSLQTALDSKAASSHTHTIANVTGLQTALDGKQVAGSYAAAAHDHDRLFITDSRGAQRNPSFYDDRYAQWDFQNNADTRAGGDAWHAVLTVAKWVVYDASHRQEQLFFTGNDLKRRTATSDTTWGDVKTIWDSGNVDPIVSASTSNDTITFTRASGGTFAVSTSDADTTYTAGAGLSLSGTTFSHADTSSAANLGASARRYITALTFDTYGHVTAYSTGTETVVNTNTTYSAGTGLTLSGTTFSVTANTFAAASHNHDDRYYTETESDTRFVNATGDTMSGNLTLSGYANPHINIASSGGSYSYLQLSGASSNGYLIKNITGGTGNNALPGALYTYTDNNNAFQHLHNATPLFTILSGGNVGIDNTAPTARLQVGPEAHPNATGIEVAAGAGGANLLARDSSSHHNWLPFTDGNNYYSANSHTFRNSAHNVDWMTLASTGAATFTSNLTVNGIYYVPNSSYFVSGAQGFRFNNSTDAFNNVIMYDNGNMFVRGIIGINTKAPNKQITFAQVNDDAIQIRRFTTSEGNTEIGTGISWTWTSAGTDNETWAAIRVIMPGSGNSLMTFGTTSGGGIAGYAERMRITDLGNVGINNAEPEYKLDVKGNGRFTSDLVVGGSLTENSSIRYKKDVVGIESTSERVELLKPVRYKKIENEVEEIGLIAEDVAELFPEVVRYDDEGRPDGVNYSRLSVILLKAVQELTERVNKLENK